MIGGVCRFVVGFLLWIAFGVSSVISTNTYCDCFTGCYYRVAWHRFPCVVVMDKGLILVDSLAIRMWND